MYRFLLNIVPMPTANMDTIIHNKKTGRRMIIKTKEARAWMDDSVAQLEKQRLAMGLETIDGPVSMSMKVYRRQDAGDLGNYYKGVEDALQKAGVVRNDRQIKNHKDCWALVDRSRPRYEIIIEVLGSESLF